MLALQHTAGNRAVVSRLAAGAPVIVSRIFGCDTSTPGAPSAPARQAHTDDEIAKKAEKFRSSNDHLASDNISAIAWAINNATKDASTKEVRYAFFDYFSGYFGGHKIYLMNPAEEAAAKKSGRVAETKPDSDMKLRADTLKYDSATLGALLLHELSHTGQDTNFMGSMDYQEGQSYAVEYFFAEKSGNTKRMTEIRTLISTGAVALPSLKSALQDEFKASYAILAGLNAVVTKGSSTTSPFDRLTADDAEVLTSEMITSYFHPSKRLQPIITGVKANLAAFPTPAL